MYDDELAHYGILGMRWGIRRKRGKDGRIVKSQRGKDPYKARRANQSKSATRTLSDKELKRRIERMKKEKEYYELLQQGKFTSRMRKEILDSAQRNISRNVAEGVTRHAPQLAMNVGKWYVKKYIERK